MVLVADVNQICPFIVSRGEKKASLKFVLCHESRFCPSKASTYCHIHHLDILFN